MTGSSTAPEHGPGTDAATVVRGACHHDCPDTCVWDVTVRAGRAVDLRGNAAHPTTRGGLCPKVNRFLDRVHHPDRLLHPLRRTGAKGSATFEPVSWDEALDLVAERLQAVLDRDGGDGILQFSFDGTQGAIQKGILADRFFDALGASDIRRDLCGATAWQGAADVYGHPLGIDPEQLQHARTILLWGTNTLLTNRHLWPTIEQARAGGAQVVVIDPVRTPTAARADRHVQLRPGTDVALALAMIDVMARDGLLDDAWLAEHTSGWDDLRASAAAMPVDRASRITGVDAATITWLATTFATQRPAAIRSLIGPEHREHGRDIMRAIAMLPAVTGAWRDVGGGLARSTQVWFETTLGYPQHRPERRRFNMASLGDVLTDPSLAPPIGALVVHNSNPAVICPDQGAVIDGLERDDLFTVVLEQFMTDTARHADVVLPVTTQIEHLDLSISWGHLYLALNRPAVAPPGDALPNTEIVRRLAARMGLDEPGLQDGDEALVRQLLDSDHPWLDGITFEHLWEHTWERLRIPSELRPHVDVPVATPDGRMRLGALTYRPGSESPQGDPVLAARYPLTLFSRKQHVKFLNANYGGFAAHHPKPGEPVVELHPSDAAARGIVDGDRVRVHNERGALTLRAAISADLQPGLAATAFGWWHRHAPEGRSVNVLTNPTVPADGTGSAAFHETLVEISRTAD